MNRKEDPLYVNTEIDHLSESEDEAEDVHTEIEQEHQEFLHLHEEEAQEESITIEQQSMHAPDGGWGWCIVLGSSIVHALIGRIFFILLHCYAAM